MNGVGIKLYRKNGVWYGVNEKGETHGGNVREALLFAFGYGKDQAAELRYLIACQKRG